jgi:hypothetical protein
MSQQAPKKPAPATDAKKKVFVPKKKKDDDWVTLDRDAFLKYIGQAPIVEKKEEDGKTVISLLTQSTSTTDTEEKVDPAPSVKIGALLKGMRGGRGMYYRCDLHYGYYVGTNASAAKYSLTFGGNQALPTTDVQNSGEWTSFNSVFEEFFIHKMTLQFQPSNQFLAGYVNVTSTNLQSSMMVLAAYQHNQTAPTDASSNFYQYLNSSQSRVAHTARPWKFVWKNIEKFTKDGTVGDGTTTTHTQAWLNIGSVARYGGAIYACTPYATSAAPSAVLYPEAVELGFVTVTYDVSFRYRD